MSLSEKTKKWLSARNLSLKGKTVFVTGANSGVGYKTAETALYLGAAVIMACRNAERAEKAASELQREYPESEIRIMKLDLADISSIDEFVAEIREKQADIDAFVNNAGVFHQAGKKTGDGFELVIGTNYIGLYYLTEKLLPYLQTLPHPVTYINTISIVHRTASVDYQDFWCEKHYRDLKVYARSKLCIAKYSYALTRRLQGSNIRVVMSHPGIAITPLALNPYGEVVKKLAKVFGFLFQSPEKSALAMAYILSSDLPAGSIAGPRHLFGGWGYPEENRVVRRVKEGGEELISFTEEELAKHKSD